ncbi:MAG: lytic murein transglycosylase [Actinobacteria bacterium]|nr:lytic murein transglycosylase [Actinomycetota bacterium]
MAGISEVESHHGQYGGGHLDARGRTTVPIRGPRLDGSPGMARITDTDGGVLDGDPVFDRAVGPMQFIPSTWRRWAIDGDGDAKTDPDDIYDVARTAAAYLCAGRPDLTSELALTAAYLSYNQSSAYATAVLGFARQFESSLTVPG